MSDFWLGFFAGYAVGQIVGFLVEILCIASGKSDIDKWMDEDKTLEPPNEPIDEDK